MQEPRKLFNENLSEFVYNDAAVEKLIEDHDADSNAHGGAGGGGVGISPNPVNVGDVLIKGLDGKIGVPDLSLNVQVESDSSNSKFSVNASKGQRETTFEVKDGMQVSSLSEQLGPDLVSSSLTHTPSTYHLKVQTNKINISDDLRLSSKRGIMLSSEKETNPENNTIFSQNESGFELVINKAINIKTGISYDNGVLTIGRLSGFSSDVVETHAGTQSSIVVSSSKVGFRQQVGPEISLTTNGVQITPFHEGHDDDLSRTVLIGDRSTSGLLGHMEIKDASITTRVGTSRMTLFMSAHSARIHNSISDMLRMSSSINGYEGIIIGPLETFVPGGHQHGGGISLGGHSGNGRVTEIVQSGTSFTKIRLSAGPFHGSDPKLNPAFVVNMDNTESSTQNYMPIIIATGYIAAHGQEIAGIPVVSGNPTILSSFSVWEIQGNKTSKPVFFIGSDGTYAKRPDGQIRRLAASAFEP